MTDPVPKLSETGTLNRSLDYVGDVEELKGQYLPKVHQFSAEWSGKIREIMDQHGYTPQALATLCGVSRSGVVRWLEGSIPSRRDTFIRIGFAARYDLAEMNKFLQRYGRYNQLYAKSLEDSVYIFVLNSETLPHTYAICQELLKRIEKRFQLPEPSSEDSKKTLTLLERIGKQLKISTENPQETGMLSLALLSLETPDELGQFIQDNLGQYHSAFSKFYDRVWDYIQTIKWEYKWEKFNVKLLADIQGWSASLERCVSEIHKRKWFPRRMKVISLGLHLNLNREKIDELLELAYMEPLCAKNPVEGAIIFAVMDADVRGLIPDMESRGGSTALCEHVREVLEQLELPDAEDIIRDLMV